MSVSRVRHHGQPPVPRGELGPADVDHGPSSGRGQGGAPAAHAEVARIAHAEASELTEVGGRLPGGSGAIERRMATEAQREAWRAADVDEAPQTIPRRSVMDEIASADVRRPHRGHIPKAEREQASRLRGGERTRQLVAAARAPLMHLADPPVTPSPEEEPAVPVEPPPEPRVESSRSQLEQDPPVDDLAIALAALNDASLTAIDAYSDHLVAERRWEQARQALEACYRDTGLLAIQGGHPVGLPAVDVDEELEDPEGPVVESASDHAETIPAGEPGRTAAETRRAVAAAGGGPGRPAYVARMLEAMVAAGGDFTAAAEALRIKRSSLVGSMSVLRARTDLTEAEAAAIARTRVRKA